MMVEDLMHAKDSEITGNTKTKDMFEHVCHRSAPSILTLTAVRHHMTGLITTDKILDVTVTIK